VQRVITITKEAVRPSELLLVEACRRAEALIAVLAA
jgi:hypothetical protein